ncbi:MAG: GAF domain-containing protein [Candidatus Omnitrophica bacterium]|nr:GAF domain-containing protein [Candidatus Omnitrophota bacterium]
MSYAILRHRLLDVEVIIKRTVIFAGLVGSVVAVVSLVAFVSQDVLAHVVQIPRWLSNISAAALIAGLYGPLRNGLVNTTDRYLFQKQYDYKELLKTFTDEVMVMVDLKQLVQMTVTTLAETIKLEGCSLLLLNKEKRLYEPAAARGANGQPLILQESEPVITFLRQTHEPIGQDGALGKVHFPEAVTSRLTQLNARLCLPLSLHEELIGVLCLGKKKSDEAFTQDDLDILLPLARTLAIAVSNAQLVTQHAQFLTELRKGEQQKAVATLAAGLAHEIKNPLAAIKTFTECLDTRYADSAFRAKFQKIVGGEVERINLIVQQLLEFAKPMPPKLMPLEIPRLVDETLEFLTSELLNRHVEVIRRYERRPLVLGDPKQLKQVFLNLFLNSLQAMNGQGRLEIRSAIQGAELAVTITDSGPGIAPKDLPHIFEPFFTTKPTGTGLGLAVVHGIITEHGGRIAVASQPGQGTSVTLSLPIAV